MPRRYSDDQLRSAVPVARNMHQLLQMLNLVPCGANYETVHRRIKTLGLNTDHFVMSRRTGGLPHIKEEELIAAVQVANSKSDALRRLGHATTPANIKAIGRQIGNLGLDTSHFLGQAWSRGRERPREKTPLELILVERSTYALMICATDYSAKGSSRASARFAA